MTSISALKKIYNLLNVPSVTDKVGKNLYPLIAKENTTFPFVIYTKGNIAPIYSKGYSCGDRCTIEVAVVDKTYIGSVDLAEAVRTLLELHRDDYFSEIILTNVYEEYSQDAYVQTLEFDCTILNK